MDVAAELDQAREAHRRQAWADACAGFSAVDRVARLPVADLERLAESAQILGRADEAARLLRRAYRENVDAGAVGGALRCAFWLQDLLGIKGDFAQASGWIARAGRLAEQEPGCAEQGYLLIPAAERLVADGDYAAAFRTAGRAAELGDRCGDRDLATVATHIQARGTIKAGRVEEGLALLDEAMLPIVAGETSVRVTGWIYCSTIIACHELHEVRRAREWTVALNAWCDAQPQLTGAYSGQCRVHRAELLQLGGAWPDAVREARLASELLTAGFGEVLAGGAFYRLAEIHRLRGEPVEAEDAYAEASRHGWPTQPGLALLRLAQGRLDAAAAAIRRALTETADGLARSQLLPAHVEIMLAAADPAAAVAGAAELAEIAARYRTPALRARSAQADGAVHLAGGRPDEALPPLRRAWRVWRDLDAPYEAARVHVLVGEACRALHDDDAAAMELAAARRVFEQLGAVPDLARVDALTGAHPAGHAAGLSPREVEVLRLVAAGRTNHAIATELVLSDKTVARHVSNILGKLGVGSRTAAAAYAFEHRIC